MINTANKLIDKLYLVFKVGFIQKNDSVDERVGNNNNAVPIRI